METALAIFNEFFDSSSFDFSDADDPDIRCIWSIRLPTEAIANRTPGMLLWMGGDSWNIWWQFGSDANGEYLEVYAAHHMTNDRHDRIYADGHIVGLTKYPETGDPIRDYGFVDEPRYDLPPPKVQRAVWNRATRRSRQQRD